MKTLGYKTLVGAVGAQRGIWLRPLRKDWKRTLNR